MWKLNSIHQPNSLIGEEPDNEIVTSMSSLTGSKDTWHPPTTANTTTSSYWLNWRVLLCCIWLLLTLIFASTLISKHEGFRRRRDENEEDQQDSAGTLFEDETWKPCLKGIHPAWLLAFRVVAFFVLLVMLFVIVLERPGSEANKYPTFIDSLPQDIWDLELFLLAQFLLLILCLLMQNWWRPVPKRNSLFVQVFFKPVNGCTHTALHFSTLTWMSSNIPFIRFLHKFPVDPAKRQTDRCSQNWTQHHIP